MTENLAERASTQYDDFLGTVAADSSDFSRVGELLGIDLSAWHLLVVDLAIYGGSQFVTAYGVANSGRNLFETLHEEIAADGVIKVTRLVDYTEHPHDHADTNPPKAPATPLTWVTDLLAFGFKRMQIRLQWRPQDLEGLDYRILEVASICDED